MNPKIIHAVFRCYIALCRSEHYTESELGETIDFIDRRSNLNESFPLSQLNWMETEKFRAVVCSAFKLSDEQFFEKMIVEKPTELENWLYSAELRRVFSPETLKATNHFDKKLNFILERGAYFIMPKIKDGLIETFSFVSYQKLSEKRKSIAQTTNVVKTF